MRSLSKVISIALSLALLATMVPAVAFADEADASNAGAVVIDKADFYAEAEDQPEANTAVATYAARAATLTPVNLSEDMKYFAKYESSQNYAQTLSPGDGYNAMGYYQFDRRYGLQDFLIACYGYNPVTYAAFEPFTSKEMVDLATVEIRKDGEFTEVAKALNAAWTAAYEANPAEFAGLQDAWAYQEYYLPAENYLTKRGINITERADCVKGLCWGLCNLFGSYGWRKFVGGVSDGYDWNGEWQEGVEWPGCGLTDSMTDTEFVMTLCNYVVDNVSVFYKAQPQYHEGWENRYKNELSDCLSMLNSGWVSDGERWKYLLGGEYYTDGWLKVNRYWYWFDEEGYAAQDCWMELNGKRYFFDSNCKMLSSKWKKSTDGWYYLKSSGAMAYDEWEMAGGKWYHFAGDGIMQTGWLEKAGTRYYLKSSGAMACSEWEMINNHWFYFTSSGAMQMSKWVGNYYVGSDGKMVTNQWVGKYYVGDDGKWIPGYAG